MVTIRACLVAAALVLGTAAVPGETSACSCLPLSLAQIYSDADVVARVRVVGLRRVSASSTGKMTALSRRLQPRAETSAAASLAAPQQGDAPRVYVARVIESLKGCVRKGSLIRLETGPNDGQCGVTLARGVDYLVTGNLLRARTIGIHSCGYNVPFTVLTEIDRSFLLAQPRCCGDACVCSDDAPRVDCFADPCQVTTCPDGGTCTASYCGGCNASFTDEDGRVLCSRCETDRDCSHGQTCESGQCLIERDDEPAACAEDSECEPSGFCRRADASSDRACAPYSAAGGACGGFAAPSAELRCAPGLICQPNPSGIPDLPGTCA